MPSLTYRLNIPPFIILFYPISHILSPCYFPSFFISVIDSLLFLLVFIIFFYFTFLSTGSWVTLLLLFLSLCSFNPTFQSIPHNSHPQLMVLQRVKVNTTKSWVRAMTRLFTSLDTLNLCFWHKQRCTCPRRDHRQHIISRKDQLGWKIKVYFKLHHLDQKGINFIQFFYLG